MGKQWHKNMSAIIEDMLVRKIITRRDGNKKEKC